MPDEQKAIRPIEPEEVAKIPLGSIEKVHRFRQDLGDIESLKADIKQNGLIMPIAVKRGREEGTFLLLAGGRRYVACKELGHETIAANIYPQDLSDLERRIIELSENINRKDMTYEEQVALTAQIHKAMQDLLGVKGRGAHAEGHSLRDTAKMLGQSPATVSQDIKLDKFRAAIPEAFEGVKDKKEAMRVVKAIEKQYEVDLIAESIEKKRAESGEERVKKAIIESYIIGDFFENIKDVPDSSVDLCEVDTPFGIDLKRIKKAGKEVTMDYNEWDGTGFVSKIITVAKECYRVLQSNGWIIWWFAYHPWFSECYQVLLDVGFKGTSVPAIWTKGGGQTNNPEYNLGSAHEPFFYMRKGGATVWAPGRSNIFEYKRVSPESKIHPTEKPIELLEDIYKTFVSQGCRILIPFLGSGNGIFAANNVGCVAFGYDLGKVYRDGFVVRASANVPPNYKSYR